MEFIVLKVRWREGEGVVSLNNLKINIQDLLNSKFQTVGCFPPKTPSKPNWNRENQNKIKNLLNGVFRGKHPTSTP